MKLKHLISILSIVLVNHSYAQNIGPTTGIINQLDANNHIGVVVIDNNTHKTILSHNANHDFIPASLTKLYTAILATDVMGPDLRLHTSINASYDPETTTTVLEIFGSADPELNTKDLNQLVSDITKKNIPLAEGKIKINYNSLPGYKFAPGWMISDLTECEVSTRNWMDMNLARCPNQGPNKITTSDMMHWLSNSKRIEKEINHILTNHLTRLQSSAQGPNNISQPQSPITSSANHSSRSIGALTKRMLATSDNVYAESLYLNSANTLHMLNSSPAKTSHDISSWLAANHPKLQLPTSWQDGSGLSYYNNATPTQMASAINTILLEPKLRHTIGDSLPTAGKSGTLSGAFHNSPIIGTLHAKTGGLKNFSGIAGYLECQGKPRWTIVVMDYSAQQTKKERHLNIENIINSLAADLDYSNTCKNTPQHIAHKKKSPPPPTANSNMKAPIKPQQSIPMQV